MAVSPSMIDPSRTEAAAMVKAADPARPRSPAAEPGSSAVPPEHAATGFAEAAVSLAQVGLIGRAMIDASAPPAPSSPRPGAGSAGMRPVERVLAPWGVPMLPSEAARLAREAASAARHAAFREGRTLAGHATANSAMVSRQVGPVLGRGD